MREACGDIPLARNRYASALSRLGSVDTPLRSAQVAWPFHGLRPRPPAATSSEPLAGNGASRSGALRGHCARLSRAANGPSRHS